MDIVKPLIPQILAYIAIALWAIFVAALLVGFMHKGTFTPGQLAGIALGIILFAIFFFDPAQVSMHSFYRNRLARAYLGASNLEAGAFGGTSAQQNRQTDVRKRDDIELRALSPTAAEMVADGKNDRRIALFHAEYELVEPHSATSPDMLRGQRSRWRPSREPRAGLAQRGLVEIWICDRQLLQRVGNRADKETLGVASAITASAAAFNSNMGSISMTLGAGVTFLCTALNLRLGLWLPHPLSARAGAPKVFPGFLFFKEMFGATESGLRPMAADPTPAAQIPHLSDGAHFENLSLYELVRRHCRYVIVSDCGADPEVTFDDFGNAVRRIREDFGVEIEIDLSPLMPDEKRISKQHVAVGTISYGSARRPQRQCHSNLLQTNADRR